MLSALHLLFSSGTVLEYVETFERSHSFSVVFQLFVSATFLGESLKVFGNMSGLVIVCLLL